ncbi:MAG: hypothetical protein QW609_02215 [Candidatus Aenigmatarchaeota archaeon]
MKGVATHTLVIILIAIIGIFFSIIIFWRWIGLMSQEADEIKCKMKLESFCAEWISKNKEPDWNSIPPKEGCEQYGIFKPTTKEECEKIS